MSNFDLKKYLAEGSLFKEIKVISPANIANFLNANMKEFKKKIADPLSEFEIIGDEKVATAGPDDERGIDVSFDKEHMLELFPRMFPVDGPFAPYNEVKETEIAGRKIYYNNYL